MLLFPDKEDNASNLHTPVSSAQWQTPERDSTNLVQMKRLSIPNANLLDGMSLEDLLSSGRDPLMSEDEAGETLLMAASKFGRVKKGLKKPGHHIVGPAKNPDCPCEHCRYYFEQKTPQKDVPGPSRGRAHSLSHVDSVSSISSASQYLRDEESKEKSRKKSSYRRTSPSCDV